MEMEGPWSALLRLFLVERMDQASHKVKFLNTGSPQTWVAHHTLCSTSPPSSVTSFYGHTERKKLLSKSVHVSWDKPQGSPWNGHSFLKSLSIHFHTPREVDFLFWCNTCSLSGSEDERKNTEMTIPFAWYSGNTLYPHDLGSDGSHYTEASRSLSSLVHFNHFTPINVLS